MLTRVPPPSVGTNTAASNVTWTVNTSGISLDGRGYAGTGTTFGGTNVSASLTLNSNGLVASLSAPSAPGGIAAGTQTATAGTVNFANSNGLTFGMSGSSQITASHNGLTSQSNQAFSAGGGSSAFQTLGFSDQNGISFTNTNGSVGVTHALQFTSNTSAITSNALHTSASRVFNVIAATNNAGGGTASLSSNVSFTNANGATFYTSAGGAIALSYSVPAGGAGMSAGLSTGGNTSGDTGAVTGRLVLAGGNNITVSGSTNGGSMTITISGANIGGAQTGISGIQISDATYTVGTVTFQNANGMSFGSSGANGISASYTVPSTAGLISAVNVSAGTTSNNLSALTFANGNGVTFGLNASTVTASVSQSVQTQASGAIAGSGFTSAGANIGLSGTLNSNGLSLSATAAAPPTAYVSSVNGSSGAISLAVGSSLSSSVNGSTITFGLASNITTALQSTGNYLTTARASNDAVGLNTALTAGPLSWTVNSSGISLNGSGVAGTSSGFAGNLISGSMTHNTAGLNLSLNHPAWLTTAMASNAATISNVNISAGTTSTNASAFTFGNGNGVTFGIGTGASAGSLTASVATTYRASNDALGLNTAQSNVTWTANSSGLSLDARGYAGTATANTGAASFTLNSNGLSFNGTSLAGVGTTFNGTNVSGSMTLNTAGLRLDLSAANPGGGGGGAAISADANSQSTGTVNFANSNGITFGLSNNGTMTASYNSTQFAGTGTTFAGANISASMTLNSNGLNLSASVAAPGAAAERNDIFLLGANTDGNTTASGSTIGWSGLNVTLSGTNNSQVVISAPATSSLSATGIFSISTNGGTISMGAGPMSAYAVGDTTQGSSGTMDLRSFSVRGDGVSVGVSNGSLVVSGNGGITRNYFNPQDAYVQVAGQQGQATMHIQPVYAPNVRYDRIAFPVVFTNATNSTGTVTLSLGLAVYTRTASTLSLSTSYSTSQAVTFSGTVNNSTYAGMRLMTMGATDTLYEGQYYIGIWSRTTTGGANCTVNQYLCSQVNSVFSGIVGAASNASAQYTRGLGHYSTTFSTDLPSSVAFSDIRGTASIVIRQPAFCLVSETV